MILILKRCNICGKKFNEWDLQEDYSIYRSLGYGSKYDGEELRLDICIECMDKIIKKCKISPVEEKNV